MNTDPISNIIAERGKVYGDPLTGHANIGLSWTAMLQQHYGLTLDHPLPAALVAQMMVCFKMQRAARVFHKDNYDDAHAYVRFSEEFQQPVVDKVPEKPVEKKLSERQCALCHW